MKWHVTGDTAEKHRGAFCGPTRFRATVDVSGSRGSPAIAKTVVVDKPKPCVLWDMRLSGKNSVRGGPCLSENCVPENSLNPTEHSGNRPKRIMSEK
ncbi:Hypothetical protein CINCED_3A022392 [Cinara cedri]|uniref:Uncharacterized protein n=1 Tax=Cinara cedri TaxID=506608 RepID=A0A5E4MPE6_9HEMI|nr:Hypothetical protein CINCED_3A022392 [Cinara cedri]